MGKRLVSTIGVLSFFIYTAAAQEQVMTIEDLFQLADQNSKSIQLHSLAIDETTQAVEVAKNAKLPSIRAQVDLNYIGDGCMTDRDFSNGIHADMPHFGNSFVLKASQTIYAGGSINANIQKAKLQQQLAQQTYQNNQQNLIRSELRPHISLTATNEFNGPILVEVPPLNNNFNYWFAGVGISYNLDALFKSKKKLKQARIATSKAEKNYQLVKEEIENKVHEAYVNLNEAYVRLNTQQKSVQLAHENFRIVRQRYLNGLSLITDMLDASNMQLDMELQLANYQIGILYQYYLLKKITGTL
ncbi:TolC family protein [Phocaeicola plebeius]|uniref:TolC family protein n=1 Tax=Phocaeicola plebeius TaxID=310297 RepID=UPI00307DAB92